MKHKAFSIYTHNSVSLSDFPPDNPKKIKAIQVEFH